MARQRREVLFFCLGLSPAGTMARIRQRPRPYAWAVFFLPYWRTFHENTHSKLAPRRLGRRRADHGGGGAQAQTIPPFLNPTQNPAPVSINLPTLHDGNAATAPAIVVTEVSSTMGQASVGYDIVVQSTTVQDMLNYWNPTVPPPVPLPSGLPVGAGALPVNVEIPLNVFAADVRISQPGPPPYTHIGLPNAITAASGDCSIKRTSPTPALTVNCAVNALGDLSFPGALPTDSMKTGDTWELRIDYDVPNPTQRHILHVEFEGDMHLIVPVAPFGNIIDQTFTFPSTGNVLNYVNPTTMPPTPGTYNVGDIDVVIVRHGAIAAHQPALILQGTNTITPATLPPAGGSAQVHVNFQNKGSATSTSLAYSAPGFPAGIGVSNCQYAINGGAWVTLPAASCTVTGGNTANIAFPAGFTLAPNAIIAIRYDAAMPARPAGTSASIEHQLNGSAGRWPTTIAAVRGRVAGGATAVLPYAYGAGQGGTQSVPALGPLALGGMGVMVALVPGFVAARRRKAAAARA